jgi:protein-S-isoprenylcysteine O-methyltransferase Ste14
LIFFVLALAAHFLIPAAHVFDVSAPVLGAIVLFAGLALSVWSSRKFREADTEIEPTSPSNRVLITQAPYTLSRNPMYLGAVITLVGAAIWLGTLPMFVAALALFLVLNFVFVPFEEAKMWRQFGGEYDAFRRRVRRWV